MFEWVFIISSVVILEVILSVDNAVVLATMVKHLPKEKRDKALKYWIFWAYFFRWLLLLLASWLITIMWFKLIGWLYLLYIGIKSFLPKKEDASAAKSIARWFWATVAMVEVMDIVFSLDNILGVVALTDNMWLLIIWVFVGILAMRFVAWKFVVLMEKYPYLEISANIVILILGFKLVGSYFLPELFELPIISSTTPITTTLLFVVPYFYKKYTWK